jgi:hypothetical protein
MAPGATPPFTTYINLLDLASLIAGSTGYPPMFAGQKAFGKVCPQPP